MRPCPPTAEESGFVEGAKVNLNLRNFYINRNFTNPTKAQGKAEEWTQSFILDAKSGFTQGTVGFGMDVLGLYSVKLDGGKGTGGTQLLPLDSDGRPADNFGRTNVAFKAKLSQTEVKVGEWMPVLPILRSDDGRSLPQTFRGGQITSKEIDGLTLYGGQFRAEQPARRQQHGRHVDDRQSRVHLRPFQLPGRRIRCSTTSAPRSVCGTPNSRTSTASNSST